MHHGGGGGGGGGGGSSSGVQMFHRVAHRDNLGTLFV
jgi:hypothetical protein